MSRGRYGPLCAVYGSLLGTDGGITQRLMRATVRPGPFGAADTRLLRLEQPRSICNHPPRRVRLTCLILERIGTGSGRRSRKCGLSTRGQRCWVHKTANVLNKLPKSQQPKAKRALQEIWMAATKNDALVAFDAFVETRGVKYDKAVECLIKDRDALLAFYDFPAEHWKHLRTTNVIESSFATVRHRTVRSKGCLSNRTALAMIFKLAEAAEKSWRRLNGHNQLPKIIIGIKFADGIEAVRSQAQTAAA